MMWSEEELSEAVMEYLSEHPEAEDTLEGIAEWWVMRRQVRSEVAALREVLRRLTDRGVLEKIGTGDSSRYRLKIKLPE